MFIDLPTTNPAKDDGQQWVKTEKGFLEPASVGPSLIDLISQSEDNESDNDEVEIDCQSAFWGWW